MKKYLNQIKKMPLLKIISLIISITGYVLIDIGNALTKKKGEYQVIRELIEGLLTSIDVRIEVVKVIPSPLTVTFETKVRSTIDDKIDWNFFKLELMYQMGCMLSDIHITPLGHQNFTQNNKYWIEITKTAITNLEKGSTNFPPFLFKEQNTESLFKAAFLLSQKEELTWDKLEEKLNIDPGRASQLYNQIKKAKIDQVKTKRRVN